MTQIYLMHIFPIFMIKCSSEWCHSFDKYEHGNSSSPTVVCEVSIYYAL